MILQLGHLYRDRIGRRWAVTKATNLGTNTPTSLSSTADVHTALYLARCLDAGRRALPNGHHVTDTPDQWYDALGRWALGMYKNQRPTLRESECDLITEIER